MACKHHLEVSPENPACAWCLFFGINLDRDGRFCARCRSDAGFRQQLDLHRVARQGAGCGETAYCERFLTKTTPEQCRLCKSDPGFRAFLFGQAQPRRRKLREEKMRGCAHRGRRLRVKIRACCGGREEEVEVFACARRGEASRDSCAECKDWQNPDGKEGKK